MEARPTKFTEINNLANTVSGCLNNISLANLKCGSLQRGLLLFLQGKNR